MRTVEHIDPFGSLHKTVEVVGIDPFVMLGRRQSVCGAQVVGYERRGTAHVTRKVIVVHRQDNDILEIEVAGLKNTHHLKPLQRLATERYAHRLQVTLHK